MEFSFDFVIEQVFTIVSALEKVWETLNTPVVDLLYSSAASSALGSWFLDIIAHWNFAQQPLIVLMLGTGITIYMVYQFVTWLANVVT